MALQSSDLKLSIVSNLLKNIGKNENVVNFALGKAKEIEFKIKNNSLTDNAYNGTFSLIVADGFELLSSTVSYSSVEILLDKSTKYKFIDVKDFAPNEEDYIFKVVLLSKTTLQDGSVNTFNTKKIATFGFACDTQPRGDFDNGNQKIAGQMEFKTNTQKIAIKKIMPEKMVKGAGIKGGQSAWLYKSSIEITNNELYATTFNIKDMLYDGIKFRKNISIDGKISGIDNLKIEQINGKNQSTNLLWNNLTMEAGEVTVIEYDIAIGNNYSNGENQDEGEEITHGTILELATIVSGEDFEIEEVGYVSAMDMIISLDDNVEMVDIGSEIDFKATVDVNQYFDMSDCVVVVKVPDGQAVVDFSFGEVLPIESDFTTPVQYKLDYLPAGTSTIISLKTKILELYQNKESINSGDYFNVLADVKGINVNSGKTEQDDSQASESIKKPIISKRVLSITNREGIDKTGKAIAPLDKVVYAIKYDNTSINANQKNVILKDFFPLTMNLPSSNDIKIIRGEKIAETYSAPNGFSWHLGDVKPNTIWEAEVTCQLKENSNSKYEKNLFKFSSLNRNNVAIGDRVFENILLGTPNIKITQNVLGIDINNLMSNEEFTVSASITNPQRSDLTTVDAYKFNFISDIPTGFTIVKGSVKINGLPINDAINGSKITIGVDKLGVEESTIITYKLKTQSDLPPNSILSINATTTIPYTQKYINGIENILSNVIESINILTISSKNISITIFADDDKKRLVGDIVQYTITATIPKGTTATKIILYDAIDPSQSHRVRGHINGKIVDVKFKDGNIILPEINKIQAISNDTKIIYTTFTNIEKALSLQNTNSTQTNTARLEYSGLNESRQNAYATYLINVFNPKKTNEPIISLTYDDNVNIILSSIAMEKLSMSHMLNAEAEKIQFALGTLETADGKAQSLSTVMEVNNSANQILKNIIRNQMLIGMKLTSTIELDEIS